MSKSKTFIEKIKSLGIVCYLLPSRNQKYSSYKEKLSIYNFREYLYSLRHLYDNKNSGGKYRG